MDMRPVGERAAVGQIAADLLSPSAKWPQAHNLRCPWKLDETVVASWQIASHGYRVTRYLSRIAAR
jgi:hypothetical protein